ncbi:hypothetical protein CALVIDRAFT_531138 [Calocera viscosa TUFC12733]|uniref:Uncharacterized protein n=1 Tax=Calocera viscosa (strain TUFC12733) TaxID=1330018 RepID=A0A167GVH6_CALVF|nr:hypothetical protein CALVIDRAFT_531138 [Calocera viscosa TUFC12733]
MENTGVGAREARATRPYDDPGGGEGKGNCEDGCNSTTVPERDLISLDCNTCFSPLLQPVHDMAIEGAGATYVCNPHPTSHPRPFSEGQGEGDRELDVLQRFQSPGLPVSSTALNAVHIHSGNAADTAALENTTGDSTYGDPSMAPIRPFSEGQLGAKELDVLELLGSRSPYESLTPTNADRLRVSSVADTVTTASTEGAPALDSRSPYESLTPANADRLRVSSIAETATTASTERARAREATLGLGDMPSAATGDLLGIGNMSVSASAAKPLSVRASTAAPAPASISPSVNRPSATRPAALVPRVHIGVGGIKSLNGVPQVPRRTKKFDLPNFSSGAQRERYYDSIIKFEAPRLSPPDWNDEMDIDFDPDNPCQPPPYVRARPAPKVAPAPTDKTKFQLPNFLTGAEREARWTGTSDSRARSRGVMPHSTTPARSPPPMISIGSSSGHLQAPPGYTAIPTRDPDTYSPSQSTFSNPTSPSSSSGSWLSRSFSYVSTHA